MTHKQNILSSFLSGCALVGLGFDLSNATLGVVGAGLIVTGFLMYLNGE